MRKLALLLASALLGAFFASGDPAPAADEPRPPEKARRTSPPLKPAPPPTLPAEFEEVRELLLAWDEEVADFLVDVARGAWDEARITFVLSHIQDRRQVIRALEDAGLEPSKVRIVEVGIESLWMRDFGPLVVRRPGGRRAIVDFDYYADEIDDRVPEALREALWPKWDLVKVDAELEGGNLLSDGKGRCLMAEREAEPNTSASYSADLAPLLRRSLGCRELIVLPPLAKEPTGHIDMYVHLPGPGRALVGRYPKSIDPVNAARTDRAARILRKKGFRVSRVPMPRQDDGRFRTYTNALAVNRVVLVPVYPEHDTVEERALEVFRRAYRGREVIPVVASQIIELDGAVHCAAMTVAR